MRSAIAAAAAQLLAGAGAGAGRLPLLWPAQQQLVQQQVQQQQPQGWLSQQHPQQQHAHLAQQLQTRSMSFAVNVDRNNVDKALRNLNRHFKDEGMPRELRRREYRKDSAEIKFNSKRASFNQRMGVLIAQRLKWVVKRRKLKM